MTNSKELFNELVKRIKIDESEDEIRSMIYLLLEDKLGLSKMDVMVGKKIELISTDVFNDDLLRLNQHEPIQYVLGHTEFHGKRFFVNRSVLIPRPETELLVRSVLDEKVIAPVILDVGTGSGCIAITLNLELAGSKIKAIDISKEALSVAKANATHNQVNIDFIQMNIFDKINFSREFDFMVSNPPYIGESEKQKMQTNVLDFEPPLALFVKDEDPLVFYKAIARKGKLWLIPGGKVFVEINEKFGKETADVFKKEGYQDVIIQKDMDNKDRILRATHF